MRLLARVVLMALGGTLAAAGCASSQRPVRPELASAPSARAAITTSAVVPRERIHVVQRGETAYRIARNFGVSLDELAAANGLTDPTQLLVGQRLTIPTPLDLAPSLDPLPSARRAEFGPWTWPLAGPLGSRFGAERRHHTHGGVDILAESGAEVRAARAGTVVFAGSRGEYGRLVIVDHGDGYSSYYSHNRVNRVTEGDWVEQGETLAECGQSGNASAPHLHFEIRQAGEPIDPLTLLP